MQKNETLLLTAFEPFGGEDRNAALDAVRQVPAQLGPWRIEKLTVPTEFERSVAVVTAAIRRLQPEGLLMVGQAGGRDRLTPERLAHNRMHARIADNAGYQPAQQEIVPGGPAEYASTLPVERMAEAIRAAGVPAALSEDAGSFVCNRLFYGMLHMLAGQQRLAGFLHVPRSAEQARPGEPSLPLTQIVTGLCAAICAIPAQNQSEKAPDRSGTGPSA